MGDPSLLNSSIGILNNIIKYYLMFLLILYYRKQINYDLSDCLHASVTELRHICISKRWGSKLPLMKAAKVNINKRILSTLWVFCIVPFVLLMMR